LLERLRKLICVSLLAATVASVFGTNAFTASNTTVSSRGGAGSGAISGYAVTNVAYTTTAGDITSVAFDLDGPAKDVSVTLSASGAQYHCGATASLTFRVTCVTAERAASADGLTVVATQ
jgi:hypothetical protein